MMQNPDYIWHNLDMIIKANLESLIGNNFNIRLNLSDIDILAGKDLCDVLFKLMQEIKNGNNNISTMLISTFNEGETELIRIKAKCKYDSAHEPVSEESDTKRSKAFSRDYIILINKLIESGFDISESGEINQDFNVEIRVPSDQWRTAQISTENIAA